MHRYKALVLAACPATQHDGYMGHLRLLCSLLSENAVEPLVFGFGKGTPVIPTTRIITAQSNLFALAFTACVFALYAIFAGYDAMVLTSAGAPFNPMLALIASARRKPLLYDCHDPPIEATSRIFSGSPFISALRKYLQWGSRIIDKATSLTLSVSPGLDDLLRSHGALGKIERFYNLHNAIAFDMDFANREDIRSHDGWKDACILIYVGGLQSGIRGLEEQIEAVRIARAAGHNVRLLVLYGSGTADVILDQAADLLDAGFLRLIHNVPPELVGSHLRQSDLAFNKTLEYALPSKIFEYVAAGVTILSIDRDDDVNMLFRDFVIRHDDSPRALADAIIAFARSPRDRLAQIENGERFLRLLYDVNRAAVRAFCIELDQATRKAC